MLLVVLVREVGDDAKMVWQLLPLVDVVYGSLGEVDPVSWCFALVSACGWQVNYPLCLQQGPVGRQPFPVAQS